MKNKIAILATLGLIIGFGLTAAASTSIPTQCGDVSLNNASSTTINVSCGSGSPETVIGGWGTTNSKVPRLVQGQTVHDDLGIPATCQWIMGCVDVYHTTWYKGLIDSLHSQMGDTSFNRWVKLVK